MTKLFNELKKLLFLDFWGKNFFSKNLAVMHNFIWVSSTMPKFSKNNDKITRKCPERQKDGWKDGRISGYGQGSKKTNLFER